ncbi:MAG: enoyl-CoA hydratase-related protein [Myxococcota bacterium]
MAYENIRLEIEEGLAVLTVDRPRALNALNPETVEELTEATAGLSEATRALVVTGGGDKAFVAGADIKRMSEMSVREAIQFAESGQDLLRLLETRPFPVIAAVNGYALGGGSELVLACDFAVAAENAQFGQPEVHLGIIPGFGGTVRLSRRVGPSWARRLITTGERIGAETALRIGLVTELVAAGQALQRARELASEVVKNAPRAVAWAKESCRYAEEHEALGASAYERNVFGLCFTTQDQQEGMLAFTEKRSPQWSGR